MTIFPISFASTGKASRSFFGRRAPRTRGTCLMLLARPMQHATRSLPLLARPIQRVARPLPLLARPMQRVARSLPRVARPLPLLAGPMQRVSRSLPQVSRPLPLLARPIQRVSRPLVARAPGQHYTPGGATLPSRRLAAERPMDRGRGSDRPTTARRGRLIQARRQV
jgi:hypothetical protein